MKKVIIIGAFFALGICLTGCGHNAVVYSDGIAIETTANPETFAFGLNLRYGKILTIAAKEKTKVSMESGFSQENGTQNKSGLDAKLTFETGDQATGYTVELEKIKAEKGISIQDSAVK